MEEAGFPRVRPSVTPQARSESAGVEGGRAGLDLDHVKRVSIAEEPAPMPYNDGTTSCEAREMHEGTGESSGVSSGEPP